MFAVGAIENIRKDVDHDDTTEAVIAQTRAWIKQADSFEKLGRHEGRISRQLLKYTQEIDRVQTNRKNNPVQLEEIKSDNAELALLCQAAETAAQPISAPEQRTPEPAGLSIVPARTQPSSAQPGPHYPAPAQSAKESLDLSATD